MAYRRVAETPKGVHIGRSAETSFVADPVAASLHGDALLREQVLEAIRAELLRCGSHRQRIPVSKPTVSFANECGPKVASCFGVSRIGSWELLNHRDHSTRTV